MVTEDVTRRFGLNLLGARIHAWSLDRHSRRRTLLQMYSLTVSARILSRALHVTYLRERHLFNQRKGSSIIAWDK